MKANEQKPVGYVGEVYQPAFCVSLKNIQWRHFLFETAKGKYRIRSVPFRNRYFECGFQQPDPFPPPSEIEL